MKYYFCLFAFSLLATAQVLPDHYIVDLSTEPVAKVAAKRHRRVLRDDQEFVAQRAAIGREQMHVRREITAGGDAQVLDQFHTVRNALVVKMPAAKARQVRQIAGVQSVRPVRIYKPVLDHSLPLQKVTDAWRQIGGMDKAGAGIKIAIIDTGIDSSHPAFDDTNFTSPDGFPLVNQDDDKQYTNKKIIVARAYKEKSGKPYPAKDVKGHGTSVAMVAAGGTVNGPLGLITGVAPKAWLGSYKVFPDGATGAPDSIIIRAIEDAVNDGMDVLNLSLGSFPATRPANDSLVLAVENAVAAGKVVVIAAGNIDGQTTPNTIASPGSAPSAITAGSSANDRTLTGSLQVPGHAPYPAYPGDGPNLRRPLTANLQDVAGVDPTGLACGDLPAGSLTGAIVLISRGSCTFKTKANNAQAAGAAAAIFYTTATQDETDPIGLGGATLPAAIIGYNAGLDLKAQIAAAGNLSATIDFSRSPVSVNSARLSNFSGRGPNADGGVKPDLLAIGSDIYTASPLTSSGGYTLASGTSFSSPTVAGAAALLMAARPGLTAAQYRSLLVNSAGPFSIDGTNPLAVQLGGAGLLNMTAALSNTAAISPVSLSFGTGNGTVDQTSKLTVTNTGTASDTFAVSAVPLGDGPAPALSANSIALDPGKSQPVSVEFAGTALAPGVYQGFLNVQGTQSPIAARIPYWYGVPSQTPAYLQIVDAPTTGRAGSTQTIFFRFIDVNGLPVTSGIDKSIVSGANVEGLDSDDDDIPGAFWTDVTMPATSGPVKIHIELGGVGQDVTITVP